MADAQTFTWLNKQGVRSSDGFEVQCVGRFEWEYREGERVLTLGAEGLVNAGERFLSDWRTAEWSNSLVPISSDHRDKIVQNVTNALRFMGLRAEFD